MTYLFIARVLIGARRCRSANLKCRAAFTVSSLADSDPVHLEARASRVRQHNKLLRQSVTVTGHRGSGWSRSTVTAGLSGCGVGAPVSRASRPTRTGCKFNIGTGVQVSDSEIYERGPDRAYRFRVRRVGDHRVVTVRS